MASFLYCFVFVEVFEVCLIILFDQIRDTSLKRVYIDFPNHYLIYISESIIKPLDSDQTNSYMVSSFQLGTIKSERLLVQILVMN